MSINNLTVSNINYCMYLILITIIDGTKKSLTSYWRNISKSQCTAYKRMILKTIILLSVKITNYRV